MNWHNPIRWIIVFIPVLTSVFVSSLPATSIVSKAGDVGAIGNQVRAILAPDCGSCHNSALPTARAGAVKAFDFSKDDWYECISEKQLQGFVLRTSSIKDSLDRKAIDEFLFIMKKKNSVVESQL